MPYSGIPAGSAAEAKIERCVERVMAGGETDKSSAIAICRASIGKSIMDENEKQETAEQAPTIQGEKMDYGMVEESYHNDPVMGAMSFSELDTIQQAQEQHGKLRGIVDNFMRLARNITQNPAIDPTDRSAALRNLTEEMRMRLDADFKMGERTVSIPTINGKLDPVYLQKLQDSDETFEFAIGNPPFDSPHNTGFKVLKGADGSYRWLGWVSNKFMDREGEILTDEAHKDYVAWLDANPQASPELWTYHIPGTGRKNKADFWAYLNGFLLLGGKLTETEAKVLEAAGDLGMSHGFYVLEKQGSFINKYRTFEATVLPYEAAANLWTKFSVKELENMANKGMSADQRDLAVRLHGEEFVAALESDTQKMATALSNAGVQSKDADEIPVDAILVEEISAEIDVEDLAKNVAELVTKQLNPQGLQDAIKAIHAQNEANATAIENLTKRLEALELSDDEKMAKELAPKVAGIDWMGGFRASTSKETVVTEQEKEGKFKNSKPDESWASNLFSFGSGGQ